MRNSLLLGFPATFLALPSATFGKSIVVVVILGLSLSPAQVRAQSEKAAPEAPEKISRSAARAQAERQRAATAEAQRQRAVARAQAERQRAATAEAQRQRAAARAQAENERLAQEQAYANQQALLSNTVPPTAPANKEARLLNAADLIKSSDYPAGSMSRGEVGISGYELTLNNGRPASCKITSSSGFEELDKATCRLATERSVFDMSTLPKGNWSTYSNRVRWNIIATEPRAYDGNLTATQSVSRADPNRIRCQYSDGVVSFVNTGSPCIQAEAVPGKQVSNPARMLNVSDFIRSSDYPAGSMSRGEEGIAGYELTLNNGRPASCKITSSSGFEELDEATCRLATERSLFDMGTLPKGNWSTYSERVRWQIGPSEPRANSGNLTASQSISRIDPNKIRCQYSDGIVSFVNAGSRCIQTATLPTRPIASNTVPPTAPVARAVTGDVFEDSYTYGYRLWEARLYPESQATLEETLAKFPKHKRASYARNLLGRAWLDDKKPATAVKVFYDNYKTDPRGDRAPDSLFFLGSALTDLGKTAEACEAFGELERAYPDAVTSRLVERIASGKTRAKCK